jgi:hypothetical protein
MFNVETLNVLKQVHPNTGINTVALSVIGDLLIWLMVSTLNAADKLPFAPTPEDEYDKANPPSVKLFQRLYFGTADDDTSDADTADADTADADTADAEICPWMTFIEFPDDEKFDESTPGMKPGSGLIFPFATGNEPPAGWAPKSFDARTIQSAVRQLFPDELAELAVSEGFKAVKAFNFSHRNRAKELVSRLQFVPGAIRYQVPK